MKNFSKYKLKEYKYWKVYLHQNQGYLGRCVVWRDKENILDLVDITIEEREELFVILKKLREALNNAFKPDLFNYAFLNNGMRHLHGHFIPRYASEREFGGVVFKDKRWGHNYQTDHDFKIKDELAEKIRVKINEALH